MKYLLFYTFGFVIRGNMQRNKYAHIDMQCTMYSIFAALMDGQLHAVSDFSGTTSLKHTH